MTLLYLPTFSHLVAVQAGRPDASLREFFPSRHSPSIPGAAWGPARVSGYSRPGRPTSRNIEFLQDVRKGPGSGLLLTPFSVPRGTLHGESGQVLRRVRYPIGPALSRRQLDFRGLSLYRVVKAHYGVDRIAYASNHSLHETDTRRIRGRPARLGGATGDFEHDGDERQRERWRGARECDVPERLVPKPAFSGLRRDPARTLALREISHVLACMKAEILPVSQKSVWLGADGAPSVCVPRGTWKPAACTADRRVASSSTLRPMEAATQPLIAAAALRPKADTVGVTKLIAATL